MRLPVHQACEGQPCPAQVFIQPDTKVMQGHLCRQPDPKPTALVGPLPGQAKSVRELLVDRLCDPPHPCQPAPPGLGSQGLAMPLRRPEDLGPGGLPPRSMRRVPPKSFSTTYGPRAGASHARQPRLWPVPQGKESLGQRLVLAASWPKAKARDLSQVPPMCEVEG